MRTAPGGHVRAGEAPEGAIRELHGCLEGILRLDPAAPSSARIQAVCGERCQRTADRRRLTHQEAREVDEVTAEVEERVGARGLRVLVPRERRVGIEERGVGKAGPEVMDPPEPALVGSGDARAPRRAGSDS